MTHDTESHPYRLTQGRKRPILKFLQAVTCTIHTTVQHCRRYTRTCEAHSVMRKGTMDMKKIASLNRIVSVFVLVCFTLSTLGGSVMAGEADEKIVLKKPFFKGLKYQKGSNEQESVYGFGGMSFKPHFENTLAAYPPALTEAKKSFPFNGVNMLCQIGIVAIAFSDMMGTIDEASNPGSGTSTVSLGPLIGCVAGAIVSGIIGDSKVKSGVRMYNENIGTLGATSTTANGDHSAVSTSSSSTAGSSIFGFKAGLNMANQDLPTTLNKGVTRFVFGGFMTFPVSKDISVQTEALYSMKGCKVEMTDGSFTYKLNYLDFPVLFKYTFATSGSTKPFLFAGPSLGILMSAKGKLEVVGMGSEDGSIKPLYKSTDLGFVIGGGVNLGQNASIDGRYSMGLSNIASSDLPLGVTIKNSALSLMVGYTF